jgi:hypothetical protein
MITRKDINKQFFSTCMGTGFGRVVILKDIDMVGTVLMATVVDVGGSYWVNANKLQPFVTM